MRLTCNKCGYGAKRTDELRLITLYGRDYLVCYAHWRRYVGTDLRKRPVHTISESNESVSSGVQPSETEISVQ